MLREHADAVEADLQRFYGIDYRDRWRRDETSRRRLTLRRLRVLLRHLPDDSALGDLAREGAPIWTVEAFLLDEVRMTLIGPKAKPHPARPKPRSKQRKHDPKRQRKLADARRRAQERRERLGM